MHTPYDLHKLLIEVAFLAANSGAFSEAELLFNTLRQSKPDREEPLLGLAYAKILQTQFNEALFILQNHALKVNPNSATAHTFMGLALRFQGKMDASDTVLNAVAGQSDAIAATFAKAIQQSITRK